ncbi:MAG: FtsX-like permease family protein [Planctomycetota bacterium]|nr:MAG: FtsX-like permease family protein [Planctomycetota bacterium]
MGLTITIARGGLLQRPGRTLFSILGIALGITTVVGVITLDHTTIGGLSGIYAAAGNPDLEIRARQTGDTPVELTSIEGLTDASAFFQNDAIVWASAEAERDVEAERDAEDAEDAWKERGVRVRLYAVESATFPALELHRLLEGRELDSDNGAREVLVGAALAGELELAVGDEMRIARPRRVARKACIDGEVRVVGEASPDRPAALAFQVAGILAREKLGRRSRGMIAIVDYDWGKVLYEDAHVETRYWAKRDPAVDIERLQISLGASYSYTLDKSVLIGQAADERAFRTGVRMAGLLALVLGLYVIFHTLSMSLTERMNEIGTLHAIGVTRAQVARIFLFEAVALAGCGALLGLGGGIALAWVLLARGITTLGVGKYVPVFLIPWNIVLSLTVVGFLIALVGSVYPLSRLGGANTVAALRGESALESSGMRRGFQLFFALLLAVVLPGLYFVLVPVVGEFAGPLVTILLSAVGVLALLVVLPLAMPMILTGVCSVLARPFTAWWPLSGRLATRAMRHSATRIAVSASAIALVSAGLVSLKGLTRSLRGEVEVWADEAARDKVWVKNLPNVPVAEFSQHLAQFPGVIGVEQGSVRTYGSFLLFGVDVSGLSRYGPCADDPTLLRRMQREHGMILSRRVAQERKYEVGDLVYVSKADGSGQDFEVVAISDAYGYFPQPDERMYGVVADTYMKRYFCLDIDTATDVAVRLEEGTDPGVVEAAVRDFRFKPGPVGDADRGAGDTTADMSGVRYETGAALLEHHVMDIDRDFVLFDILVGLTAALAALGVLNGQLLAALERSKEIGILKALGVSARQIGGMVLIESLVVGIVGGVLGVLLGTFMTPLIVDSLQELAGLTLPDRGPGAWIVLALVGATLLTLLAGLYPIWRMNRFDAVRAVRTG